MVIIRHGMKVLYLKEVLATELYQSRETVSCRPSRNTGQGVIGSGKVKEFKL